MIIGNHDTEKSVFIIAEIGNNHEGDLGLAKEMLAAAVECGVDAVKFQTFQTEHYVTRKESSRFRQLQKYELTQRQFQDLKEYADGLGTLFLSTPFDVNSATFLNDLVPAFKISSGDNTFYPLLNKVAEFDKPILLSTGLADIHLVLKIKQHIERKSAEKATAAEVAVLHCVTSYPAPADQACLENITRLAEMVGGTVGYSDHTLGHKACDLAVAAGARILEKHFTLDHNLSDFRDHKIAADPQEMKRLVASVRETEAMMSAASSDDLPCERPAQTAARRSIAAGRDLHRGERLTYDDLTWVRPGGGFVPGQEDLCIGRKLLCDVPQGSIFSEDDFEGDS